MNIATGKNPPVLFSGFVRPFVRACLKRRKKTQLGDANRSLKTLSLTCEIRPNVSRSHIEGLDKDVDLFNGGKKILQCLLPIPLLFPVQIGCISLSCSSRKNAFSCVCKPKPRNAICDGRPFVCSSKERERKAGNGVYFERGKKRREIFFPGIKKCSVRSAEKTRIDQSRRSGNSAEEDEIGSG